MTKFGQAEYSDFMARYLPISLIKFLKKPKNRISTAEIQKIYTMNLRHQRRRSIRRYQKC